MTNKQIKKITQVALSRKLRRLHIIRAIIFALRKNNFITYYFNNTYKTTAFARNKC